MSLLSAAAIGAGVDLVGNLLSHGSQKSANRANLQIAQMNNEFNAKMMEKQMQYNTEMWNKENQYNSAKNQVARLREAGLNPYLALGHSGQAGSVGSVTPPQAQSVTMNPTSWNFDKIADVVQAYEANSMHKALNDAQVTALQIDNQTRALKNLSELNKLQEDTNNVRLRNQYQQISNNWANSLQSAEYQHKMSQVKNIEEDTRNKVYQGLLMSKELSTFDERFKAELANTISQTALNRASAITHGTVQNLNREQAKKVIADTVLSVVEKIKKEAETKGIILKNRIDASTINYQVHDIIRKSNYGTGLNDLPNAVLGVVGQLLGAHY